MTIRDRTPTTATPVTNLRTLHRPTGLDATQDFDEAVWELEYGARG